MNLHTWIDNDNTIFTKLRLHKVAEVLQGKWFRIGRAIAFEYFLWCIYV